MIPQMLISNTTIDFKRNLFILFFPSHRQFDFTQWRRNPASQIDGFSNDSRCVSSRASFHFISHSEDRRILLPGEGLARALIIDQNGDVELRRQRSFPESGGISMNQSFSPPPLPCTSTPE
ncbi:hypothetical protein TNCT_729201 [Trichonephila clavata]|uniref:Uncharacterized protein n=1 Tax=Trichonephila clavata TaxID=2740835 RepID=A0A8X6GF87_TRICU|nr:hypothetical protein TNCT_729201 [Trichonephila clavata]